MGAHSTIHVPLDVARRVYRQVVGPDAPDLSKEDLAAFYDRALDDQLYEIWFADWRRGPFEPRVDEYDLVRWLNEYFSKNPDRLPTSKESENRYLRDLLNLLAPTTPALDGPNWLTDTVEEIHRQLDERIRSRLRKP